MKTVKLSLLLPDIVSRVFQSNLYGEVLTLDYLTDVIFFIDWASSLIDGQQLTDAHWSIQAGRFVIDDLEQAVKESSLGLFHRTTSFGRQQKCVNLGNAWLSVLFGSSLWHTLNHRQKEIIEFGLSQAQSTRWTSGARNTYPYAVFNPRVTEVNFPYLANSFVEQKTWFNDPVASDLEKKGFELASR